MSGPSAAERPAASDASVLAVEGALEELRAGRMVILVDHEDPQSEGDLVLAASACDAAAVGFMRRHGSGVIYVPMTSPRLDALGIPLMTERDDLSAGPASTVSVDAREGVTTGVGASDRARTIRLLADPATRREDLVSPGHVFPVRASEGGVLVRAGHAEAAVDLCRLAGLPAVGVLSSVSNEDGSMARLAELVSLAREHGLRVVSLKDLIRYRMARERLVEPVWRTSMPTRHGTFEVTGYRVRGLDGDIEHVALTLGDVRDGPVLVRVQAACFAADVLGSLACDCRARREAALALISQEGRGVLLYLRSHGDTSGVCEVQVRRGETVEAEQRLGPRGTQREYGIGAQILTDLGVTQVRLLTNYQHQMVSLYGLEVVERVPFDDREHDASTAGDEGRPSPVPAAPVDRERYRQLAGSFPTGVTIVTTRDPKDGSPKGLTSQTFVGLSTEPPLIMVAVAKTSRTLAALLRSRAFVVNFLKRGAEALADRFATKDEDKFRGVASDTSTVAAGAPILKEDSVAYAECVVVEVHEAGDHWIFVGRVDGGEMFGGTPLMYYRRTYAPWPDAG